jgi:hypothetical protein
VQHVKGNLSAPPPAAVYKLVPDGDVARVEWVEELDPEE